MMTVRPASDRDWLSGKLALLSVFIGECFWPVGGLCFVRRLRAVRSLSWQVSPATTASNTECETPRSLRHLSSDGPGLAEASTLRLQLTVYWLCTESAEMPLEKRIK